MVLEDYIKQAVFVGDKPSSKNISPDIPFVGASCYKRFVEWIGYFDLDYYTVYNFSMYCDEGIKIEKLQQAGFAIVALGLEASKRLNRFGIEHFTLPHPSGLNRKINDPEAIQNALSDCQEYIDKVSK